MSAPRTKRPFAGAASDPAQRQITSFFSANNSQPLQGNNSSTGVRSPHATAPVLPASVQSNLLSVGMRVRKSVPEGYKTISQGGFSVWSEQPQKPTMSAVDKRDVRAARVVHAAASRELLPFCGIHSVGGMGNQSDFATAASSYVPDLADLPGLSSSQESVESVDSFATAVANNRKRVYGDEDADLGPVSWRPYHHDGEVSPRSQTPVGYGNARMMAVPRGRLQARTGLKKASFAPGQENMGIMVASGNDFPEAEFLEFEPDSEMDIV